MRGIRKGSTHGAGQPKTLQGKSTRMEGFEQKPWRQPSLSTSPGAGDPKWELDSFEALSLKIEV